jgi:5-formyltetrahydrofolate cyclo-ligase
MTECTAVELRELKRTVRHEVLAQREALLEAERSTFSARITEKILALDSYERARCVAAYMSIGTEFDTSEFVHDALASGKRLILPRVNRAARRLDLYEVTALDRDLVPGVWGIREPRESCPLAPLEQIDWMLVPGVAFTRRGERLGYGAGFYDRLIASLPKRPILVAAGFALQLRDAIPMTASDELVDLVITEEAEYYPSSVPPQGEDKRGLDA